MLSAYYDYALNAELIRLEQSNQQLLQTTATATQARNRARQCFRPTRRAEVASNDVDMSGNDIAGNMQSQLPGQLAMIQRPFESSSGCAIARPGGTATVTIVRVWRRMK